MTAVNADDEPITGYINSLGITPDGELETSATRGGDGRSLAETVVLAPNAPSISAGTLEDQASLELTHPLAAGDTIEVYAWGAYLSDGTVPTGLTCRLLDGADTVIAEEETQYNGSTSTPVATYENTGSSTEIVKLQVFNNSGGPLADVDGVSVGGTFSYVVI
jgi:hypothetical protein